MANLNETDINDTGYLRLPAGTTAERPASPELGMVRWNTDESEGEYYDGTEWAPLVYIPIVPTWVTNSGSIGSGFTEDGNYYSVTATTEDSSPVTYSRVGGSLPPGLSLNSSTGVISGVAYGVADYSTQTFSFTIRATSVDNMYVDRLFSISITSRYLGYSCSSAGENGVACDTAPAGTVFNRLDFISYGTPGGGCGYFSYNFSCHSGYPISTPTTSYCIGADNNTFGDPCFGTVKYLYIQMSYGLF